MLAQIWCWAAWHLAAASLIGPSLMMDLHHIPVHDRSIICTARSVQHRSLQPAFSCSSVQDFGGFVHERAAAPGFKFVQAVQSLEV